MITGSVLFSLKCTRNRLAAGFRPDTLGSLSAPLDPLVVLGGGMGPPRRGGRGREVEEGGRERKGGERKGRKGKGRGGEGTYHS